MRHRAQLISTPAQVAEIIRGRRKARRLSQATLAAKLGVSQSRLSTLEAAPGKITLDRLIVFARLLGFEIVLRDRADQPAPKSEW